MEQNSLLRPENRLPIPELTRFSSVNVPDVTNQIVKLDGQRYAEAGGFADVYKCQLKGDSTGVTEVSFRFMFSLDEKEVKDKRIKAIRRELGIWKRLSHPNIVPFLGVSLGFGREGNTSLVSLWMPNGTIQKHLTVHEDKLTVVHRLQLLLDIAKGLCYLHSFPIVHGDLSCNNVLIDHHHHARLVDFGFASLVGETPNGFTYLQMTTGNNAATLRWCAPEYLHSGSGLGASTRTIKSDIYSFGNMALLVMSGRQPWSEVSEDGAVLLRLYQGHKPGRPSSRPIEDDHWELIEQCWSPIDQRPRSESIVISLQRFLHLSQPFPDSNQCTHTTSVHASVSEPRSTIARSTQVQAHSQPVITTTRQLPFFDALPYHTSEHTSLHRPAGYDCLGPSVDPIDLSTYLTPTLSLEDMTRLLVDRCDTWSIDAIFDGESDLAFDNRYLLPPLPPPGSPSYSPDAYEEHYPKPSSKIRSTLPDGPSTFKKTRSKKRRPFTEEEDRALKAGYEKHGTVWATIVKDPIFQEQNRRSIDLRDRFRGAFPELYRAAGYKPRNAPKKKKDGSVQLPVRVATRRNAPPESCEAARRASVRVLLAQRIS